MEAHVPATAEVGSVLSLVQEAAGPAAASCVDSVMAAEAAGGDECRWRRQVTATT